MLDSLHKVYAFGKPRSFSSLNLSLLLSSMEYAVRIDKDNQRITLPPGKSKFCGHLVLHSTRPGRTHVHRCVRGIVMSEAVRNTTLRFCEWARQFF